MCRSYTSFAANETQIVIENLKEMCDIGKYAFCIIPGALILHSLENSGVDFNQTQIKIEMDSSGITLCI